MASSEEDALALLGLALILRKNDTKTVKRRRKKWLLKRKTYSHVNLLNELKFEPEDYKNYLRMDENTYLNLLAMVTTLIKKRYCYEKLYFCARHERLAVTLRFLATGRSYEDLKFSAIISPQALGKIIPETCEALYEVLRRDYLKFPTSEEEWKEIAKLYEERWNFPHCLGALDGKHIAIVPPANSGSYFYNYKDVDMNGRISDGGVLQHTKFFEKLQNSELHIPTSETLTGSNRNLPYVFVANDAFPLRPDMMKPFRQADLTSQEKKILNYRLFRARHTVENPFGILASRFRIFYTHVNLEPENIDKVVKLCTVSCALHNFLIVHSKESLMHHKDVFIEKTLKMGL